MKLYNALVKKNESGKIEDIIMIKEGFSWKAFIFNGIWFIYHRLWREIIILFSISLIFVFFAKLSNDFDKASLQLVLVFMVALNANHWLCDNLKKKGYEFVGIVFGSNNNNAKLRFVQKLQQNEFADDQFSDAFLNPKQYYNRNKKIGNKKIRNKIERIKS